MKPSYVIAALGVALALALAGWYFYMGQNPPWEPRDGRGLEALPAAPGGGAATPHEAVAPTPMEAPKAADGGAMAAPMGADGGAMAAPGTDAGTP